MPIYAWEKWIKIAVGPYLFIMQFLVHHTVNAKIENNFMLYFKIDLVLLAHLRGNIYVR